MNPRVQSRGAGSPSMIQLRYSLLVSVIFMWSLVGFPLIASIINAFGQPSTAIVIAVRALIAGVCLVLVAQWPLSRRAPRSMAFRLFLLFFAAYALRIAYDTAFASHFLARDSYVYWSFAIGVCFLPALTLALYARYLDVMRLYGFLVVSGAVVLVLAIFVGDTMLKGSSGSTFDSGRLSLESLNPISLGHVATSVIVLCFWRLRMLRAGKAEFIFALTLGLLGVYVLFATGSRGPLVALLVAILFLEAVKGGAAAMFLSLAAAPFLITLTFDISSLESALDTNLFSRFEAAFADGDASTLGRVAQISSAWEMFLEAPLIGARLEDPEFGIYPHNVIVEALMALGLFGGALFVALLLLSGIQAFRVARANPVLSLHGALFFQYLAAAQLSGSLYTSSVMWALLACISGLGVQRAMNQSRVVHTTRFSAEPKQTVMEQYP